MKIFFLYHERWKNSHSEPLLRIKDKIGIECVPCPSNPGTPELLWPDYDDSKRRFILDEIFKKIEKQNPDLVIVYTRSVTPYLLKTQMPLVLLEHTDGTALELSRHLINLENVLSVVKGSVFVDYNSYNSATCEGMFHGNFVNFFNLKKQKPYKVMSKKNLKKILLGYSFGCFPQNKRFLSYDIKKNKNINISFMGNIKYSRSRLISQHREMAALAVSKIKDSLFEQNLPLSKYDEILLRSKICLSPYGYGVCYRSFESIFCGCLTIQPYSDFMRTWPNIFEKNKIYFECKSDFSDLNNVYEFLIDNYENFIEEIFIKRQELIDCFFNDDVLSNYIYENIILKSIKQ